MSDGDSLSVDVAKNFSSWQNFHASLTTHVATDLPGDGNVRCFNISFNDSVLTDPAVVAARAVRLATDHQVVAVDGTVVEVRARSICIHGDTPGAVQLAQAVRAGLEVAGVPIQPFTQ